MTDECPECGNEELESWTEELEYGQPLNWQSRGNVAPKYRTRRVRIHGCDQCGWCSV